MKPIKPLSIDQAQQMILRGLPSARGHDEITLNHAFGRVAAQDVTAPGDQPRFDSAAMDGWVVRGQADLYNVVGENRAGVASIAALGEGQAAAISTGAMVPAGATALVRREQGREVAGRLTIAAYVPGRDVRLQGSDFRCGDVLVHQGRVIDHLDIARVAAAGLAHLAVTPVPRVALLATGDEIMPGGTPLKACGNYDALSPAIVARIGQVEHLGVARDADADLAARVAVSDAQVLIVIGGASGGRHDRVRHALADFGLEVMVPCVAMRPGKPFWCGHLRDGRYVFGLPGNPVAALVALELFVMPALAALQGSTQEQTWIELSPEADAPGGDRLHFARWGVGGDGRVWAQALGDGDSAALVPLAQANGLIRTGEDGKHLLLLGVHRVIGV